MDDYTPTKRCSKCGNELPETAEYFRERKSKNGKTRYLISDCRNCEIEYKRERRRQKTPGYLAELEKNRERGKKWYQNNKELHREISDRWLESNHEKMKAYWIQWQRDNPDKVRARYHRRKARKLNSGGTFTGQELRAKITQQKGKCWWCGKKVGDDYHADHLTPLARGGSNDISNIVISCPDCNLSKGAKLPHEWIGRLL